LGICCQEDHKLYAGTDYNIATMTIAEWFNSAPVQQFRQAILGNTPVSACRRCYVEESHAGKSRRLKSNQKSVIFIQAFQESFEQSPWRKHFDSSGLTATQPIDIHVDLGNYCNLACKMCNARASSQIAAQEVKWGIESSRPYLGQDWTKNADTWASFKQQLLNIPGLNNIHFMGGETLLTDRFEDLVDCMIEHGRFDLCFSFVTNGTIFQPKLMAKLSKFRRVGIEVSIETVSEHNAYQRQGTDTAQVLANIEKYQEWDNGSNITITLRPAISALTIGHYHTLLAYALANKFIIKSLLVNRPEYLDVKILPESAKSTYIQYYENILQELEYVSVKLDYNESDPNNFREIIKQQARMCINMLGQNQPGNIDQLQKQFVEHCKKWDQVYGYNAVKLYPELAEVFDRYGY
jgi:molybdenum cofactor biosynthesis enzyme MoaA